MKQIKQIVPSSNVSSKIRTWSDVPHSGSLPESTLKKSVVFVTSFLFASLLPTKCIHHVSSTFLCQINTYCNTMCGQRLPQQCHNNHITWTSGMDG